MRWYGWLAVLLVVMIGGGVLVFLALDDPELATIEANVMSSDLEVPAIGFAQVTGDYEWQFPQDYGPHPDFQREQWHIQSSAACPDLVFALLFDQASFVSETYAPSRQSEWAMNSIMTGSLIVNEVHTEIASRIAIGLAGANETHVWLDNWVFEWTTINWVEDLQRLDTGKIQVESQDIRVGLNLLFDFSEDLGVVDGWYSNQTKAWANGDIEIADEAYEIDCPMFVTRRFK